MRQRATPLPPPLSLPLSLSTLSSRSIHHHPYHRPTTPGVDASRVVATGSERSMPSMRSLPLSVSPFHFVPLCNSFLLPSSSSCRLEPLLLDLPSHAHASIRDNKRVYTRRRWSTSPRLNVFMHTGGRGCMCSLSERDSRVRMHRHARTHARRNVDDDDECHLANIPRGEFSRTCDQDANRSQETSHASTRQTFACRYQLPV